jgi:hypothetical protein
VIGTSLDGERRVLLTLIKEGKENLEGWKEVLKNLLSSFVLPISYDKLYKSIC